MTTGERPYIVGAIFSAQHGHIRSHVKTLNELDEVSDVHLCAIEGGELEEVSELSTKLRSGTRDLDELLGREEVEFVLVCARNDIGALGGQPQSDGPANAMAASSPGYQCYFVAQVVHFSFSNTLSGKAGVSLHLPILPTAQQETLAV